MASILRGDVWWVSLDPAQGAEIQKTRPCLVLTSDVLNRFRQTVVVVPFSTSARAHPPISVVVTCQGKSVVAIIDQIRAVGRHRLKSKIETASSATLQAISKALEEILELG
ncbi:MAG TPA: type II toxin-antitoxin system PemK/MazF family toxin [Verrucomicrobiae bacterium]|nr:type II toxin-antitoxin system PemK/MazF family toxin [Verrucomicrobiae bacterium]